MIIIESSWILLQVRNIDQKIKKFKNISFFHLDKNEIIFYLYLDILIFFIYYLYLDEFGHIIFHLHLNKFCIVYSQHFIQITDYRPRLEIDVCNLILY
jgi:hypothetical protein